MIAGVVPRALATVALGCALAVAAAGRAEAGGSRDLADAWLVGPGCSVPARAGAGPGWEAQLAAGRLYGLAELPQVGLAGRVQRDGWSAHGAWHRLGADLLREDGWRLGLVLGRRWGLGVEAGADRLAVGGDPPRAQAAVTATVAVPLGRGLEAAVWLHLTAPPPWHGAGGLRRVAQVRGRREALTWAVALDRAGDSRPALQLEALAWPGDRVGIGLRADPWSGSLGLSTAWRVRVGWLRTSHLAHPELGVTHRWALVVGPRAGGPA